ncbi:MAG: hypothetical protein HY952_03705 [Elusimicrobia bacterium]|nr:hypothetical protein [Elusimicrobiota bacterium]
MKLAVISIFRKTSCALLLGAFAFGVVADPIIDLLFPHQGSCEVCAALAGGHGVVSPVAGPALTCDFTVIAEAFGNVYIPTLRVCRPIFLSRAPPGPSYII